MHGEEQCEEVEKGEDREKKEVEEPLTGLDRDSDICQDRDWKYCFQERERERESLTVLEDADMNVVARNVVTESNDIVQTVMEYQEVHEKKEVYLAGLNNC